VHGRGFGKGVIVEFEGAADPWDVGAWRVGIFVTLLSSA
jgi:hypothetical protein